MSDVYLFKYSKLDEYCFSQLPKGYVLEIAMNPYNGKVLLNAERHDSSTVIGLDVMRLIVEACEKLEAEGAKDPLRKLLECADGFDWESLGYAAKAKVIEFEGRSGTDEDEKAAEGETSIKQAS